jgi:signal transduction histidine kinase
MPVRIVIADDHEPARRGIRSLVSGRADWLICGEAADGSEAVELARQLRPDVVLMDMSMPRMNVTEAARLIRQDVPESDVIIVSQNDVGLMSCQVSGLGARRYVSKANLASDLIPTIDAVIAGRRTEKRTESATPTLTGDCAASEMGSLIQQKDWAKTPVGAPEKWSPALRMMVSLVLANRFPLLLWWGPEYIQFYNDAYKPIPGAKHPNCLGQPASECWPEIWNVLKPLVDTPFHGGPSTWSEDLELEPRRSESLEETHFTVAYSPVPDSTAPRGIGGVLATVHEITEKIVGERRLALLRDLAARGAEGRTVEDACLLAAQTLAKYPKDVPFALVYLLDAEQKQARLVSNSGIAEGLPGIQPYVSIADTAGSAHHWPLATVLDDKAMSVFKNIASILPEMPAGPWSDPPTTAVVLPIPSSKPHEVKGFLVLGVSVRLRLDEDYRTFFQLIAAQLGTAISNADAYDEERRRAEALAEIDRAKTLFFSNISHEFRTPLTLMLGPLEDALAGRHGLAAEQRERLEVAHRNSLRLLKLVNTLLDFSRIEAGRIEARYEPTDLAAFTADLSSVFRSAVERAGLRLIISCLQIPETVYVDREMWEKIVFNLISNAIKFTFTGEIEVALRKADDAVELVVRDTGIGIPPEDLPHLFERFYRVKGAQGRTFEGSGIGLALVQELAKLHGGSVRVESHPGEGSAFTVTVPLGKDHLPADRIGTESSLRSTSLRGEPFVQEALGWLPGSPGLSGEIQLAPLPFPGPAPGSGEDSHNPPRVLLADDNADMRAYLQRLLQDRYEVAAVAEGESALESARQQRPDLVLCDVMMPRLDGFGLLQALRADDNLNTIPVILVSARAGEEARIEGLRAGADDYLVKPFSARELLARIDSQLSLARLRRHAADLERQLREKAELERRVVRESEERFRAFVNAGSFVVYRMSPDWSEMRQLDGRGFISDTAKPRNDWLDEYILPDEQPLVLQKIREAVRTRSMFQLEHRVRRTDGTLGWAYSRAVPVMNEKGDIIEWFGAASDVTAGKEIEQKYRQLAETLDAEVRVRTRELEERNAEILRQSDYVRELSWQLLRTQDDERRHIARELHDSAGQMLAVLGWKLGILSHEAGVPQAEFRRSLEEANEMVQQLTKEIRTMSYLLHPPLLDEGGLPAALSWYIGGLTDRSGLDISFKISDGFGRLPRDMELVVFRLVQECLTNIHRHSGSRTAAIQLLREAGRVLIEVRDHGRGISTERLSQIHTNGSGVGIRGMRERLRQFRGEMTIDSTPPGTTVLVTIPIPARDQELATEARSAESAP